MKTEKFRLTLDVEFDSQGVTRDELANNLRQIISDAVNNGTLTGDSPAMVEHYSYKIDKPPGKKRHVKSCKKCGSKLNKYGRCSDITCPYNEHPQSTDLELLCGPNESQAIINNYPDGICPDCGWKIRKNVTEGDECRNCGHVFYSCSHK